jgi:prepilin-type N-terminal cleavage/methylation domain-containing protein
MSAVVAAVKFRDRGGLTLIELLVTISVMATVAGMFTIAYRSASAEAFRIKSDSTIRKISLVLSARMQEYDLATVPVLRVTTTLETMPSDLFVRQPLGESVDVLLHRARLGLTRQVILQEMPDHPDDLKWSSYWVPNGISLTNQDSYIRNTLSLGRPFDTGLASKGSPVNAGTGVTSRTRRLINRLTAIDPNNGGRIPWHSSKNGRPWDVSEEPWEKTNANSELLYLIVEDSSLNGSSAIELFGRSEIGDTDQDGLNEFLDAYGSPISWVRWPTSNVNVAYQHPDLLDPMLSLDRLGNEPIDRFKADPGYAKYNGSPVFPPASGFTQPLVISPGPDRQVGVLLSHPNPVNSITFPRPSFSGGDFLLTSMPYTPTGLLTQGFLFVDPWYPRGSTSGLGSVDQLRLPFALDDVTNFNLGGSGP